ncbi:MAG: shikimate dehydrogenase [Bacteroidota bacterium]
MNIYGLIGKKISYSFSPDYFNKKFKKLGIDAEYRIFELEHPEDFPEFIDKNPSIVGLNVTIPYKRSLGMYMNYSDKIVSLTGSVNTIKIIRNNNKVILSGFNTDVIGFEKSLSPLIKGKKNISALILGTGGSSKSIAYVLRKLGIIFCFVSRNYGEMLQTNYEWLDKAIIDKSLIIINTTPLGTYPKINEAPPIPYELISDKHIFFDLVYNPSETLFMKKGKEMGATCINGLNMLENQAEASWKIWNK